MAHAVCAPRPNAPVRAPRVASAARARRARRALDTPAVVIVGVALSGHEHAGEHRRGSQERAHASLVASALLLLELVEARMAPLAVRGAHLVGEVRVVAVDGVDDIVVAVADPLDP